MIGRGSDETAVVRWLAAQSAMFGLTAALLGVAANALFLDAYGPSWLPVTYIAIGFAGAAVSGAIARGSRRYDLVGIAVVVLGSAAVIIGLSWPVARAGGDWVSAILLVLFPILIELGFVFIGAQGGRLLDIAGIKSSFPRIMAGFPVGAIAGGLLGGPLVALLGSTADLLLVTALSQAAFAALVWLTGRRFAGQERLAPRTPEGPPPERSEAGTASWRRLVANPFVAMILGYQVLSALGSQLSDFLVMDRASAYFPDVNELAGYISVYTAIMNTVVIVFLLLLAGPLMRRYGLRLGIMANPAVVTAMAAAMAAIVATAGGGSAALLAIVSATRIADIALSDGTTRTSLNAMYQVLPERTRLGAQATVEGMGVPIAIAISGVLILVLNMLPFALEATIAATVVVCAAWTYAALRLYRAYGPALGDALRRRPLLDMGTRLEASLEEAAAATGLLASGEVRSARLGLELFAAMDSPVPRQELAAAVHDTRPEVRLAALSALAGAGDPDALGRLAKEVREAAVAGDAATRAAAGRAAAAISPADRASVAALLTDPDSGVRNAALSAVQPGDEHAVDPAILALREPATLEAATDALGRLGDAALPGLEEVLARAESGAPDVLAVRLVRAASTRTAARDAVLLRHVGVRDRDLGLAVLERIAGPDPAPEATATMLDRELGDDARHAARILAATSALLTLAGSGDGSAEPASRPGSPLGAAADGVRPLLRALAEELTLLRARIVAGRLARHGWTRLGGAIREAGQATQRALALEALDVLLPRHEAAVLIALLDPDESAASQLARLAALLDDRPPSARDADSWLLDIAEDGDDAWRSPWLRACAIRAISARGGLASVDVARMRALRDPVVDEELAGAA